MARKDMQNSPLVWREGSGEDFHEQERFLDDENERSRTCCTSSEFEEE
ncbi:MAG: hypothetical protein HFE34_03855 [Clostridia bacterium]|nr:hypothetical protein [Clostridia bacterium]